MSRAGTGARDQVARLLTLVPLLHARGELPVAEAADLLGTSPQQVVKDLKVLWMCGLPGGYPDDLIDIDMDALTEADGDGTIRVWNADYLARPVRLSPTEATALIVALQTLAGSADEVSRDVVERALSKLEKAAADGAGSPTVAVQPASPGTSTLPNELRRAAAERLQVRLTYWVPSRDERTTRVVEPHRVGEADGAHYLEAHCTSADGTRVFRLDRILDWEVLQSPASTEAPEQNIPLTERLFSPGPDTPVVELTLSAAARWVAAYYPVEDAREAGEGRLSVDLRVQNPAWLTSLVLRLAPHARVVTPGAGDDAVAAARLARSFYS